MCLVFTLKRFYCRRAITEVSAEGPRRAASFVCALMGKVEEKGRKGRWVGGGGRATARHRSTKQRPARCLNYRSPRSGAGRPRVLAADRPFFYHTRLLFLRRHHFPLCVVAVSFFFCLFPRRRGDRAGRRTLSPRRPGSRCSQRVIK